MKHVKPIKLFQDLMKSSAPEQGCLLGLYVGIAISDMHNKIDSKISKLSLSGFVFGYPLDRYGMSPQDAQVNHFVDDLRETGKYEGLRYTMWNECSYSKLVERTLEPLNLDPVAHKQVIDQLAAVGTLQAYLNFVKTKLRSTEHEDDSPQHK